MDPFRFAGDLLRVSRFEATQILGDLEGRTGVATFLTNGGNAQSAMCYQPTLAGVDNSESPPGDRHR